MARFILFVEVFLLHKIPLVTALFSQGKCCISLSKTSQLCFMFHSKWSFNLIRSQSLFCCFTFSMRLFTAAAVVLSMATICLAEIHWDYMIFSQQWAGTLCSFKEVRLIHCFSVYSRDHSPVKSPCFETIHLSCKYAHRENYENFRIHHSIKNNYKRCRQKFCWKHISFVHLFASFNEYLRMTLKTRNDNMMSP